ncbi:MAG: PHP domain-containing protein, partial [Fibrobacteres bacterium]|nr:PHP domain-containing protein [Fibrobacterota bacterium]
ANATGSILAYAYLGDVGDSLTGDKKTQTFEDSYLDLLFSELKRLGFRAVTYMPSRNTIPQLLRIQKLCAENGLLEISGEDINSSRQSFICQALAKPEFSHLIDMTWALIGHEKAATEDMNNAFFSAETINRFPSLKERIEHFKKIGKGTNI